MTVPVDQALDLVTFSAAETGGLAARLAAVAVAGDVVALFGGLGAGKTEFVKGFAHGLSVSAVVNSPSFVLMAEYSGRLPLFHLDLFRLSGPDAVVASGLTDERRETGVTVVEWAERLGSLLPGEHLAVTIEGSGDEPRQVRLQATAPSYRRYLAAAGGEPIP